MLHTMTAVLPAPKARRMSSCSPQLYRGLDRWQDAARASRIAKAFHASPRLSGFRPAGKQQRTRAALEASIAEAPLVGTPNAENPFGRAFLSLFGGPLFYLSSFAIPATVCFAAWGATHAATVLAFLTGQQATAAAASPMLTPLSVALSLTTVLTFFGVAPIGDAILGRDLRDQRPPEGAPRIQRGPITYRLPLYAYILAHYATLAYAMHAACTGILAPAAFVGLVLSMGVSGAVFFTVAHELLHGSPLERSLSDVLLTSAGYLHWADAHKYHHINVGTPEDCTTARRGESLWAFLPRCIWGNLVNGYRGEARRLASLGKSLLSPHNRMLLWIAAPSLLAAAAHATYGWAGVAFLAGWSAVAIWCVETVNFIEHYGLVRKKLPDGRYEHVSPRHSWSTGFMFCDSAAFRLQRHADHHLAARKHYQYLCDLPDAPQLPADYPLMMLMAAVPPIFFKIMDPLLDQFQAEGDASQPAMPAV